MSDPGSRDIAEFRANLRALTQARIGLPRAGVALATSEILAFQLAHAEACDAVGARLDVDALRAECAAREWPCFSLTSAAGDRATYLTRPDLGRSLNAGSRALLEHAAGSGDLAIVIADGLSARAAMEHAMPLLDALTPRLVASGWRRCPIAIVEQGRVAIGDEIGGILGASMALVLIGERPGLTSPRSLGAYLTYEPRVGRHDAERNCLSNIRPEGLGFAEAAARIAWLCGEARRLGATGVALKDETPGLALVGTTAVG